MSDPPSLPGERRDRDPPPGFRRVTRAVPRWDHISALLGGPADAPPLLLLHGFTGSAAAWGRDILEALAESHRVIAVDLPGHGASGWPGDDAHISVPALARLMAELLPGWMDDPGGRGNGGSHPPSPVPAPGDGSAVWLGYSMGGRVALAAGVLTPHRVRALILESTSPGLEDPAARESRLEADNTLARDLEAGGIEAFVDRWLALPLFEGLRRLPPAAFRAERTRRLQNDPAKLAGVLRKLGTGGQPPYHAALGSLEAPTLILAGGDDTKFAREARSMDERVPQGRRVEFPGVGHVPHRECPEVWLAAVLEFLGGLSPRP